MRLKPPLKIGQWAAAFVLSCIGMGAWAQSPSDETETAEQSVAQDAAPPLIPTSAFAERYEFGGAKLSPDGKRFAYTRADGEQNYLYFFDADTREAVRTIELGKESEFRWFRWAGNDRILYSLGAGAEFQSRDRFITRLFLYDFADQEKRYIGFPKQDFVGDDVIYVDPAGEFVLLDVSESIYKWPDVWHFPLDGSGHEAAEIVRKGRESVTNWHADNEGVVRLGYGPLRSGRTFITYRSGEDSDWRRVARFKYGSEESERWSVYSILAGSDAGLTVFQNDSERDAVYQLDYATGEAGQLIYEQPGHDIEDLGLDRTGNLTSVYFTDDAPRIHWIEPEMARYQRLLENALPGGRIRVISRTNDNTRMLVWSGGEDDPGALYVFTPEEKRLDLFAVYRPDIDQRLLAKPVPIDFEARDGTQIRGFLTLPRGRKPENLPLIVMPHGGPYGVRDSLVYDDEVQLLANRGYAVIQPNYRGSGGYGDDFEKLGEGQIGKAMQDDLDDALGWAVGEGYADPDRVCIVGGSYGGFAALFAVLRNPEKYRCAASWAGVTDWRRQLRYDRNYLGKNLYNEFKDQIEGEDDFDLNDASPAKLVDTLSRPVLLAHGKKDKRVPFAQFEYMVEKAEDAGKTLETLVIDDGHGFTSKENEQKWFDTLTEFLAEHNPAD